MQTYPSPFAELIACAGELEPAVRDHLDQAQNGTLSREAAKRALRALCGLPAGPGIEPAEIAAALVAAGHEQLREFPEVAPDTFAEAREWMRIASERTVAERLGSVFDEMLTEHNRRAGGNTKSGVSTGEKPAPSEPQR